MYIFCRSRGKIFNMRKIILASASPRRQELLKQIGLQFDVLVEPVDETFPADALPGAAVCEVARRKAHAVLNTVKEGIIIGADTVVVLGDKILGKPTGNDDAVNTLTMLSGCEHLVITGFCVIDSVTGQEAAASATTRVFFRQLTSAEILSYVNSGEPMDKAGAYGIQGLGALLVDKIEGCYFNVVGLPLTKVALTLRDFGVEVLI